MDQPHDMRLINSSSMIIAGPTQSGKTTFVKNLLKNIGVLFRHPIQKVYWIGGEPPRDIFNEKQLDFQYINELPTSYEFVVNNSMVIIDDMMSESKDDVAISNLFTKITHHYNVFAIYITQNFFEQCNENRIQRRNCQYVVLFKNPADMSIIRTIGSKMFPDKPGYLTSSYNDAVKYAHGYLLLDLRQETDDCLRVRTMILPHEYPMIAYKQNGKCKRRKING